MATKEELLQQQEKVQKAIDTIMTAGQEFQTRTSRVKMADLSQLRQQLAEIKSQLAELDEGRSMVVLQKFGGW